MARKDPTVPHLTFSELGDAADRGEITQGQVGPCPCWEIGHAEEMNGEKQHWTRNQVRHPKEFDAGMQVAREQLNNS